MLSVNNLEYEIDEFKLEINSLEIKENVIHTIVGESGSGKSTLLNLIAGHLIPKKGEIKLDEINILELKPNERNIGLIFQKSLLFPNMNVYENIAYPLKLKKKAESEIRSIVLKLLSSVGMKGFEKRMPNQLSGGQQKRVAIARTLANQPKLLLMDEALNSLDPKLKIEIMDLIKKLKEKNRLSICFITHDFEEALKISDYISVIENGRIIHTGDKKDLLFNPKSKSIVRFFQYYNRNNVFIENNKFNFLNKEVKTNKSGKYKCILPPQEINIMKGKVAKIIKKYYLKYGKIYEIQLNDNKFFVFSHNEYKIDDLVDYEINEKAIIYLKEDLDA